MPQVSQFAPGTPSWVDLGTPDIDGSAAFYSSLFGWEAHKAPEPEAGGYVMFTKDGLTVAGMGPLMQEGQPPAWGTYVTVVDADTTIAAAREAGAQILLEPMDVMDAGRMATLMDTAGAVISIWQPKEHIGAELVNEPGSLCWNELATRDPVAAAAFYDAVFGWQAHTSTFDTPDGERTYTEWHPDSDGGPIGGMIVIDETWPAEMPSHWMTYFAVEDPDATAALAKELGGTVEVEPFDIPPGRMAVLADPSRAYFTVIAMRQDAS